MGCVVIFIEVSLMEECRLDFVRRGWREREMSAAFGIFVGRIW